MANPLNVDEKDLPNLRNKYELIIVAAKRSRQLRDGSPRLNDAISKKEPITALHEILDGKVVATAVPRIRDNEQKKE